MLARLCRRPDRGIRGAESSVSATALYDLEEEAVLKRRSIEVVELPLSIAVVQQPVALKGVQRLVVQVPPRRQIVIVICRQGKTGHLRCGQTLRSLNDVGRSECNVVHARTGIGRNEP